MLSVTDLSIAMPKWGYSIVGLDPDTTVRASGREVRVSHKAAREVCKTIRGMKLDEAKDFLQQVILKRRPVPFRRFSKKVGHRRGLQKAYAGRYPVKAAQKVLEVLEGAEANAEYKGLDVERLRIIHASAYPGMKIRRYIPRAFGRASPRFETLCHLELVLEQMKEVGGA
ncbi:MAG: 50S ribosomal protein L22P [Candidatus Bathyarchaeota archaeon BA1]|nr:MAG: 50S ribosomal protein L22P [Candidatus Bathyarchaeota archaeon BA1]